MTASNSNIFQRRIEALNTETPQQKEEKQNIFQKKIKEQSENTETFWDSFVRQSQEYLNPTPEQAKKQTAQERQGWGQAGRAILPKIAGFPGDLYRTIKYFVGPKSEEEERAKDEELPFTARGAKNLLESLPTSSELTQKFDVATEGQYLPKSKGQERFQEITGDASLLIGGPSGIARRGLMRGVIRPIGAAVAGTGAREIAESAGLGEKGQAAAKLGAMLFTSVYSPGASARYRDQLYETAANLRGNDVTNAATLERSLLQLENELTSGLGTRAATKSPVLADIEAARQNIRNGQISLEDLEALKRDINTARSTRVYEPEIRGRPARRELKRNYDRLSHVIDETVNQYGQQNPEYLQIYNEAKLAHGGILASENARNFIRNVFRKAPVTPMMAATLNYAYPGALMKGVIGAGLANPALRGYQFAHRLTLNPALRRNYTNLMQAALREDAKGVIKYTKELTDEFEKDKKNYPF